MLIYHSIIFLGLFFIFFNLVLNLIFFRRPKWSGQEDKDLFLSILIPARNEEQRIGFCLESLLSQKHSNCEIIVLDDRSEDGTQEVLKQVAKKDSRLRWIEGKPLPDNWTGKAWACHQLSKEAQADFLLFTDADTRHDPESVSSAMEMIQEKKGDLLSLWPYQNTKTWGEKLIIPFVHVLLLFFLPHWMPGRFRSLGAANGQFMLFRRKAYEAIGGHETVQSHLVEDVGLGREIKQKGLRLINADGSRLVSCRMYHSFHEIWEGFTKNMRAGFEKDWVGFIFFLLVEFFLFFMPFVWLIWEWVTGKEFMVWVLGQILLILGMRFVLALRVRQSYGSVLFHPLGQLVTILIALNSWVKTARGEVTWKGRKYTS